MTHARRSAASALAWLPALLTLGCITINLPSGQIEPLSETVIDGEGDAKVLMIEVEGVITETSDVADFFGTVSEGMVGRVREELDLARSDDKVKALVLRINSPGGTVTGSDLLYDEIQRFKQDRKVPVVAQLMGTAASGGVSGAGSEPPSRVPRGARRLGRMDTGPGGVFSARPSFFFPR